MPSPRLRESENIKRDPGLAARDPRVYHSHLALLQDDCGGDGEYDDGDDYRDVKDGIAAGTVALRRIVLDHVLDGIAGEELPAEDRESEPKPKKKSLFGAKKAKEPDQPPEEEKTE